MTRRKRQRRRARKKKRFNDGARCTMAGEDEVGFCGWFFFPFHTLLSAWPVDKRCVSPRGIARKPWPRAEVMWTRAIGWQTTRPSSACDAVHRSGSSGGGWLCGGVASSGRPCAGQVGGVKNAMRGCLPGAIERAGQPLASLRTSCEC